MRKVIVAILLLAIHTSVAYAQCKDRVEVDANALDAAKATDPIRMVLTLCNAPFPQTGDSISVEAAGTKIDATVMDSQPFLGQQNVTFNTSKTNALVIIGSPSATLTFGSTSVPLTVVPLAFATINKTEYTWSIGPATKGEEDGESDDEGESPGTRPNGADTTPPAEEDTSNTGALNFKYSLDYARGGLFGMTTTRLWQTTATLDIDTTDQDSPDYIDNNRAAVGISLAGLSAGRLFMHGDVGVEARLEKALHHDIHNADAVVKVAGWVPAVPAASFFGQRQFITTPLSFTASYGYRNREQADQSFDGRVFEASALYHVFLFDQFMVSLNGTLTVNDLSNRATDVPRTQRMYKATIAYLQDPSKPSDGFKVLTSIENGSFGVMLKEVRQYFIGVGFSKLSALTGRTSN